MNAFRIELEVSRVYESQYFNNIRRTLEEAFAWFFLAYNVFKSQIKRKIIELRESGNLANTIAAMEKHSLQFQQEIEDKQRLLEEVKTEKSDTEVKLK